MPSCASPEALTRELTQHGHSLGVDLVGCTSSAPFVVGEAAREILPEAILPGARSIVVAACATSGVDRYQPSRPGAPRGRLGPWTRASVPAYDHTLGVITEFLTARGYRTAAGHELPLKATAVRAGIAYYGKNSIVHAEGFGSYLELAAALTDAELICTDRPVQSSDCPDDCRACMEACPTGALAEPFRLTRDKCICHYLWGAPIPREHRQAVGDLIFRCDACQQACPRNHKLCGGRELAYRPQEGDDSPVLLPLLLGDETYYRSAIPEFVQQAGLDTVRRNAAIAAGNIGDVATLPALLTCLSSAHDLTRIAAAWALGRFSGTEVARALAERLAVEENAEVRDEIACALHTD